MLALAACGTSASRREEAALTEYLPYTGAPIEEFHYFRLDGWQSLGDDRVVIWTSPSDAYMVTVEGPCTELGFTNRLGITSTFGTVSHFEALLVRGGQRCPIKEIRPINVKQLNADRAAERAERAKARAAEQH
jgi:hypothetical protein